MNRARFIRLSTRLANSVTSSTQRQVPYSLNLNQVTHFSHLTQSPPIYLSRSPLKCNFLPNSHQIVFYSSKPKSLVELLLSNDWSETIETELDKLTPNLTHEFVVHVLVNLSKNPQKSLDFFKWVRDKKGFEPSSVLYSLLLRNLASKSSMKHFWDVASQMERKGLFCDEQTYLTVHGYLKRDNLVKDKELWSSYYGRLSKTGATNVVKNVVNVILGLDWSDEVEGKLKRLKVPLTENFLLAVFKELWPQPLKALRFFEWLGDSRGYEHNALTYNAIAKVLAQEESMGEFWDLVKRMRSEGYEMDTDTYIKISRNVRNEDAVKLFEFMMDGPYKPSEQSCALLLRNISNARDPNVELVSRVVKTYEEGGNSLTKAIYDGLHRCLCKVGKFDEAQKLVETMRNAGFKPDNITYSQEIFGLCQSKMFEEAWKVLEQMEAEGCVPDLKTWSILIQGYITANQMDEALSCFAKMIKNNVDPDPDILHVLLKGFLSHDKLVGAYRFLIEMVKKIGLKPFQSTYKLMIEKLLELGKLEEAHNLLSMMKKHDYPPFPEPFVSYISKSGTVKDAFVFLKALIEKGSPSSSAYVHVIRSFYEEGRLSEAEELFYKSPARVRAQKALGGMFGSAESSKKSTVNFVKDEGLIGSTESNFVEDEGLK